MAHTGIMREHSIRVKSQPGGHPSPTRTGMIKVPKTQELPTNWSRPFGVNVLLMADVCVITDETENSSTSLRIEICRLLKKDREDETPLMATITENGPFAIKHFDSGVAE